MASRMSRHARLWIWQRIWLALIAGAIGLAVVHRVTAPPSQLRIIQSLEIDRARSPLGDGLALMFADKACSGVCVQALASGRYPVVERIGDTLRKLTLRTQAP